jgi:hypothetical protein
MKMSESITAIAPALVKAQSLIEGAVKDSSNPAFRSKYADLSSVLAVIRQPMADNDLCVLQSPSRADGGVEVETLILHKSGEWISQNCFIPITKMDAHGTGSGITYGRRYGLMSIFCIGTEDDDGNTAAERGPAPKQIASPAPSIVSAQKQLEIRTRAKEAAQKGIDAFREYYKGLTPETRQVLQGEFLNEVRSIASDADKKEINNEQNG